jgi:hypothetical protein
MSEQLVSAYAASRLLERDRQTIERAVRHLPPDGYQNGQPRWHLERVAATLAMSPQERRQTGKYRDRFSVGRSKPLDGMRVLFEKQVAEIAAEPSREKRRELALALAPLIGEYQETYIAAGRALRIVGDDVLTARAELIWGEMLDEVAEASRWPRHGSDFVLKMIEATAPDAD